MNDTTLIGYSAVALFIYFFILYSVVANATKSTSRNKELLRQSLFLEALVKKLGVTEAEVEAINKSVEKI